MIPNRIINVIDNAGNRLTYESKTIRGNANYRDILTVITPATLSTVVIANYLLYDARNENITQYLVPSSLKGKDLIDPTHENYQDWAGWNVFEVSIHQNALAKISRHNKGKIGLSFNFVVKTADTRATNFIGYFGNEDVPASATEGDYYICELSTYVSTNAELTFNYGQYAIWVSDAWVKSASFTLIGNTTTKEISVDPSVVGIAPTVDDETSNDIYAELGSIQDRVTTAEADIDEVQQNITNMKDGTDAFSEILLGTAQIRYNSTKKIVEQVFDDGTTMEVGLELWAIARNEDSTILKNGEVGAVNGVVGQQLSVIHADPSNDLLHFKELGVCTMDAGIAVNATGKITHFGEVNGIPIANFEVTGTPYAENQELYVSVNGKLTNVQPDKPITHIHAGWILRTVGSNANIFVYFVKVPHFDHLSDVIITTPTNGDVAVLGSDGIWRNSQRLVTAEGKITTLEGKVQTLETQATTIYDFKGSVAFESLPTTGQKVGDAYNITNNFTLGGQDYLAGTNVAWNGTTWDALASRIPNGDEVEYSSGVSVNEKIDTKLDSDKVKTAFSETPLDTNVISEKLAKDNLDLKVDLLLNKPLTIIGGKSLKEFFEESNDNRVTNLIANGNFENGTSGYIANLSTLSIVGGKLVITATSTNSSVGVIRASTMTLGANTLFKAKVKVPSNSLIVQSGGGVVAVNYQLEPNTWEEIQTVSTPNNASYRFYRDSVSGDVFEIEYLKAYNLDSLVTSGVLESPTQNEFNAKVYEPYYNYFIVINDYQLSLDEISYLYNLYLELKVSEAECFVNQLSSLRGVIYGENPDVQINIPSKLYALVGKELNVYFNNLVLNPTKYKKDVVCSIGAHYERMFRISPSSDGSQSLIIKYKDESEKETLKTTSIVISQTAKGSGVTKKVLVIGDSTTAGGIVTGELLTLFGSDVMDITLIGTQGTAPNLHEGRSGWTINQFVISGSPFYIGGVLDFSAYMTANGFDGVDIVIINLGINDIFGYTDDELLKLKIRQMIENYNSLISSIKTYNTNVEIGLAITIPPASSQDAFGYSYTNGQTRERYLINLHEWQKRMIEEFDLREDEKLYLVPIHTNLDTEYNFPTTTTTPNSRNATSITVQNNGVHPANSGYYQIADVMYYWIKSRG